MVGQPYKVNLHLEMPESPKNKELGKVSNRITDSVRMSCSIGS